MTRIRYRKHDTPGPSPRSEPDWPVYDVQVQDQPRGRWRHAGQVARFGQATWAALGEGATAWTAYRSTRQAAVDDMLAGRTHLDAQSAGPTPGNQDVAEAATSPPGGIPASAGDSGHGAARSFPAENTAGMSGAHEQDEEVHRTLRYQPGGGQAPANADHSVRHDSDARYGGFIAGPANDGSRPRDRRWFGVYDDAGRRLARTRSFRGALMVLSMPRRTRWISEQLTAGAAPSPLAHGQPVGSASNPTDVMPPPGAELTDDSAYRAALAALDSFEDAARHHEKAAETLEAQVTVHGFDRHPALMAHIAALRELGGQARTEAGCARQVLTDHHAAGEEYHASGTGANSSAFRRT